ncbi:MAG: acyl carrier protein [Oscillospiraceae bacterium]|nr:acyl carrier protein [Oscillospiraceae bacterium]
MDFEAIAQIIAEQFDRDADELREDTDIIDDLGCDSMDAVDLIVAIESATDIRIPDEAVDSIHTIGDIVAYLNEHGESEEE